MLDRDIRPLLVRHLSCEETSSVFFHELPLARGAGRADIVAVNGHIAGFEIKSERDSLVRLPEQVKYYDLVCEMSTVVIARKHLTGVLRVLPQHWGVVVFDGSRNGQFETVREPELHSRLDLKSLIRLLWKEECIGILRRQHVSSKELRSNLPVVRYWEALEEVPFDILIEEIREALKARAKKKSGRQQRLSDG